MASDLIMVVISFSLVVLGLIQALSKQSQDNIARQDTHSTERDALRKKVALLEIRLKQLITIHKDLQKKYHELLEKKTIDKVPTQE